MCGITGFAGYGTRDDLIRMNTALAHRGPDAEGFFTDMGTRVYLGHKRLSIIDLASGDQPMTSSDNDCTIVFNGEIYNYRELRRELESLGTSFTSSHSDTEVVLHGYRRWGKDLLGKMNGMWSFCIYDKTKQQLFFARDRFGKKPFFYTVQNGTFAFGSELSALRKHSALSFQPSRKAMKKYFAYGYIPHPHTIFENVYKMPGGYCGTWKLDQQELSISKWWDFSIDPSHDLPDNPVQKWGEEIRHLLSESVQRRLMSDVPLGIFLSGGIDSSAVAAFAAQHTDPGQMKTFTIGFEEKAFDESSYAARMANLLNTPHNTGTFSIDTALELAPHIIDMLDEPMGDPSLLPTYLLSRYARENVTVALGGDGGDELFAGYDPFRALKLASWYEKLIPGPVHRAITLMASRLPVSHSYMSLDFKLKKTLSGLSYPPALWTPVWMATLTPPQLEELFGEKTCLEEVYEEAIAAWDACPNQELPDKVLTFFTKLYLQDDILVKADRAGMMVSLEVRSPFLDNELVETVRKIPWRYKLRGNTTKYILKKALEPVLPHDILYRKKKGFGIPVGKWFREEKMTLSPEEINVIPLNHDFIEKSLKNHQTGDVDNRLFLWNCKVLGRWLNHAG